VDELCSGSLHLMLSVFSPQQCSDRANNLVGPPIAFIGIKRKL